MRIPLGLIRSHLVTKLRVMTNAPPAPGASVVRPVPFVHPGGGVSSWARKMRKVAKPVPAPVRTGPSRIVSRESVPTGFSRLMFRTSPLYKVMEPIIRVKMAEGKPYSLAFLEAKQEAQAKITGG